MKHKPSCLLGNTQSAMNLVRGNTVLAANKHPQSRKPFLQRDGTFLKDRTDFYGKLATAGAALPALLGLEVVGIFGIVSEAIRTTWAIVPAHH